MDGIRCSVYEFVPIEVEDSSLSPLIQELKDKDIVIKLRPSEFDDDSDCTNENIVKSSSERVDASPESAKNLEDSAVNSISKDKTCNSLCKVIPNKSIQPQLVLKNKASIDPEGSSKEISKMGERNENLQNTKVAVEPPIEMDTSCQIMKGVDEEQNYPCTYVVGTDNYDGNESKCEDHRRDTDSHKSPVPFVNLPDNETQSMDVTSITLPHGPNENGNEDKDCQLAIDQGHFTKEENSLKPKSVSDGHGTIKGDVPGVSCQSLPVGQPFKDGEKDASTDKMLPMQYANSSSTSGDHTISEKNVALDKKLPKENDYNESVDQAEMLIFGEQEKSNDSTPLQDGIVDESQAEVLADVSVVSCSPQEQDDELIENQVETAHILGPEAASYHPPKDGDSIQEVEAGPQVLPLQDNPVEVGHEPNEMAMNIDVYRISLDNYEKDPKAENVLSVFEDSDSKHKLGSEDSEADTRCPTPTNGDGPLLFCQATLGQQNDGDGKKDASSDEMLQTQYANENTSMNVSYDDDDDATSEENLIIDMDKMSPEEHDPNDSMDETNNEIVSDQKTSDNDSKPMQDGIVGESQAKVLPDVSVVNFDQEKDDKLIENEVETAHILAQKAVSHHQAQSPQDGFTLLQDPSEMRLFGKDDSLQEVEASPHVLPLQDNPVEVVYEPKAMAMNTDLDRIALENCKKDPIVENILSVFVDSDSQPKLASKDIEADKICPTSTNGEGPVGYCQAILDGQPHDGDGKMDASSEEMLQTQYANENFMDGGVDSISEEILDIQSEFNERCPTPTRDENLYEYIPSLEQSIPNQVCKSSPGKEHRTNSTLTHQWGKEVYVEPELKLVGDQDPGRELCEENQNPRSGLLKTTDLPSSLIQSPALCRKSIGMDNVNGQTPVKRKMFSEEGCLLPVPCPPKKMSSDQELCKAPIPSRLSDDLHQPRTGCQADEVYKVKEMDNLAISNTSDGNEIKIPVIPTTLTDTLLDNHTSENNQHENEQDSEPNYMDAVYRFNESGMLTPTRTSIDSMSDEGEYFSSSSFDDPIQDCPIVKKCGQSSSIHSDDHRGVTEEDTYTMEPSTSSFKYTNYTFTKTVSKSLKQLTETCIDSDLTQFSMEQEFLIFSEEMKLLLNGKNPILMHSYPSSDRPQSVLDLSIGVDVAESSMGETLGESILYRHAFSSNGAEANVALSDIEAECARSFHTMMDNVCAGKTQLMDTDKRLRDHASSSRQMRSEMLGSLNHGLNSVVRQSSKTKFRFYILMTSDDAFFEETKVPHLLDLKKSTNVLFAGIDQPDDIGNLTHQDLFKKGGFIMLEGTAMEALSFYNNMGAYSEVMRTTIYMIRVVNAPNFTRFSTEEAEKKHLMKSCQETGIVEVLPYHQCDQLSREHPSYLSCLLQLQVQNITARFPVFVTGKCNECKCPQPPWC
ncbi:hypothetical protein NHX12_002534 [Muraenolepis orangiensis]|uniref:Uncharacterized protein n=1 Tax=Muraenolepis orangiensis TaxID=630683 RepID=A0A9Q0IFC9_9TELE|nr:hypothetical protein NHX12_002534 [Muraenolepis orangiensis]